MPFVLDESIICCYYLHIDGTVYIHGRGVWRRGNKIMLSYFTIAK